MKTTAYLLLALLTLASFTACKKSAEGDAQNATDGAANPSAAATDGSAAPVVPDYQEAAKSMPATTVAWNTTDFDFGKVKVGEVVRHTFVFTNTGSQPIVIQKAKASCGCTVPKWTEEPVPPGEKGEIPVEFDTKGKVGVQSKTVTVTANFEGGINQTLRISGEVLDAPQ